MRAAMRFFSDNAAAACPQVLDALAKAKVAIEAFDKLEKSVSAPDKSLLEKLKASLEAIGTVTKALTPQKAGARA